MAFDWDENQVRHVVASSLSYSQCLRKLNLNVKSGGNFRTLKSKISLYGLDVSHFQPNAHSKEGKLRKKPLTEVMTKDSGYNTTQLKKRLFSAGLLEEKCCLCGQLPSWEGKPLTLQLDHVNGDNRDNRIENLRILCPNCHSQTVTYGRKTPERASNFCLDCSAQIYKTSTRCRSCASKKTQKTKVEWPSDQDLLLMVQNLGNTGAGEVLGVSEAAVRKRLKKMT